jgi:hybrid cluster-associated redox disulfide protein
MKHARPPRPEVPEGKLSARDIVGEVLAARPKTVRTFVRLKMACPGCELASLMTLGDAAQAYGLDPDMLIAELEAER